jgi:hypothetical protein
MEMVCVGQSIATIADDGRAADNNGSAAVAFSNSRRFIGSFPQLLFFWPTGAHFPKFVR